MLDTRARKRGHYINGELLDQMMAARSLQANELAALAHVSEDTISRARRGLPIGRNSLSRLAAALLAAPANPLLAELTSRNEKPVTAAKTVTGKEGRTSALDTAR